MVPSIFVFGLGVLGNSISETCLTTLDNSGIKQVDTLPVSWERRWGDLKHSEVTLTTSYTEYPD